MRNRISAQPNSVNAPKTDAQRRAVIFFVDDLHLAPDSLVRTRKALLDFIDRRIGEKDLVAITSPSGQIGFLQQFTADKDALRSAVARLNYRANTKTDMEKPPMSEYIALKIREGDEQAMVYYIQETSKAKLLSRRRPNDLHSVSAVCQTTSQESRTADRGGVCAGDRRYAATAGRTDAHCGSAARDANWCL